MAKGGIPYKHERYKPGNRVKIKNSILVHHPQSPLAGRTLTVTTGTRYPALEAIEGDQTKMVPVEFRGGVWYVDPSDIE